MKMWDRWQQPKAFQPDVAKLILVLLHHLAHLGSVGEFMRQGNACVFELILAEETNQPRVHHANG